MYECSWKHWTIELLCSTCTKSRSVLHLAAYFYFIFLLHFLLLFFTSFFFSLRYNNFTQFLRSKIIVAIVASHPHSVRFFIRFACKYSPLSFRIAKTFFIFSLRVNIPVWQNLRLALCMSYGLFRFFFSMVFSIIRR